MSSNEAKPKWTMSANVNDRGEFVRAVSSFRNWVKADGSTPFLPASGRYHLYVSFACPWAHRTLIVRKLKGLDDVISVNVVHYHLTGTGWHFDPQGPDCTADTVNGKKLLREVYEAADPNYAGRITVPVLWDRQTGTIVSNESSEIIRMLNSEFNAFCATKEQAALDLCPADKLAGIDELNAWIYDGINNGVYKSGFATTQDAYEKAVTALFAALDRVEAILAGSRYLTGKALTEADVRLYTTIVRFDPVYVGHFKCNIRRIVDYPHLWNYLKELYQTPGFGQTTNMVHIKRHYYMSHTSINPTMVVPVGPEVDFNDKHNRGDM